MSDPRAQAAIDVLNYRKGFDMWWFDVDEDTQAEILEEMSVAIQEAEVPK